tara:strand:+ start:431 stop:814 length:384 start_codon:yes stop_codon:yes gene_type:complete
MKMLLHPYPCYEIYPIDSDTLKCWVQVGKTTRELWRVRLKRIEGGELGTEEGGKGLNILAALIRDKSELSARYFGNPDELDKYGRHVGDIEFEDGSRLVPALIAYGHHWTRLRNGKEIRNQKEPTHG